MRRRRKKGIGCPGTKSQGGSGWDYHRLDKPKSGNLDGDVGNCVRSQERGPKRGERVKKFIKIRNDTTLVQGPPGRLSRPVDLKGELQSERVDRPKTEGKRNRSSSCQTPSGMGTSQPGMD